MAQQLLQPALVPAPGQCVASQLLQQLLPAPAPGPELPALGVPARGQARSMWRSGWWRLRPALALPPGTQLPALHGPSRGRAQARPACRQRLLRQRRRRR